MMVEVEKMMFNSMSYRLEIGRDGTAAPQRTNISKRSLVRDGHLTTIPNVLALASSTLSIHLYSFIAFFFQYTTTLTSAIFIIHVWPLYRPS